MISSVQLSEILSGMTLVVKQAGEIIRQNWDKPRQIFHKSATDLVTNTDFAVQEYLEKNLADLLPEALFLGEEHFDPEKWAAFPQDRPVWVVDPLDGTTNFSHGLPQLAISAGLCQKGRPIAGVIYQPLVNECFYAAKGQGAFLDGKKIQTSTAGQLLECLCASGSLYADEEELKRVLEQFANILRHTQALRMPGSAAINLAWISCGRLDAFFEAHLKPWDVAAGWLLVEEAGGKVTDYLNGDYSFWQPICATNSLIHHKLLELLNN